MDDEYEIISLGTFTCVSGTLIAADPGLDHSDCERGIHAHTFDVLPGEWQAFSIQEPPVPPVCAELVATHCDHRVGDWIDTGRFVGVDTAQAGFFDAANFHNVDTIPNDVLTRLKIGPTYDPDRLWYSFCCELVESLHASVLPSGVISESARGDGSYRLFVRQTPEGRISGLKMVFMTPDD